MFQTPSIGRQKEAVLEPLASRLRVLEPQIQHETFFSVPWTSPPTALGFFLNGVEYRRGFFFAYISIHPLRIFPKKFSPRSYAKNIYS